jgi:hypothetical protein
LANLYSAFQNTKGGGRGPKDEAEFKTFIKEYPADKLSMMNVDTNKMDELFKSERDSQPLRVKYNVGGGRGSVDPVVFETTGKNGKIEVYYTMAKVDELDAAAAEELLKGAKPKSAPGGDQSGRPNFGPGNLPPGVPPGTPTGKK